MEKPMTCVFCTNACDLKDPRCGRGRKMAEEVTAGTWSEEKKEEMMKNGSHRNHDHDRKAHEHHGRHGGHHHGQQTNE